MNSTASFGPPTGARSLLETCALEATAGERAIDETLASEVPSGTRIYITALPGVTTDEVVRAAIRLRRSGLDPVPHLAARSFQSHASLQDFVARLTGEASVSQVLLIGGDIDRAKGPFSDALEVLRSGVLRRHGIERVGLAGYPEGHPRIPSSILDAALIAKIEEAAKAEIAIQVITQFCFSAQPIAEWIARFSQRFPNVPIHVGLAGPAAITTLLKYAVTCGIGPSVRALRGNRALGRALTETNPATIIDDLMRNETIARQIAELHFFTFGGIRRTSQFVRQLLVRHQNVVSTVS